MLGRRSPKASIVFLHIPKTAGQTVHNELTRVVGKAAVSPVRVHTQAAAEAQFPAGYRLYSGHLDWTALADVPDPRFVFTVLRDPRERIASFYFYLRDKAQKMDAAALALPGNTGLNMALNRTADEYFFGGNLSWRRFIRDHYDNFYCSYFGTGKMRGWMEISALTRTEQLRRAHAGAAKMDAIYGLDGLPQLEADLLPLLGKPVKLADTRHNSGPMAHGTARWPRLLERFESDENTRKLDRYAAFDTRLMRELEIR